MPNHRRSFQYYQHLIEYLDRELIDSIPAKHDRLFCESPETEGFYKKLYLEQIEAFSLGVPAKKRPGDKICKYCTNFHLSNSKDIDKNSDIGVGKKLEDAFGEFFQAVLDKECDGATIERADVENLHNPDFVIKFNGKAIIWIEFKVIFRPFLKISEKVSENYECYSHSLTLDISNGKKLENQRILVASDSIGEKNCIYVYWYDLPCIKGIFWMPSTQVYQHQDNQAPYERKIVEGDRNAKGEVRAAVNKIYLPLHEMNDFYSIVSVIKAKI
jgi:hypothetical protein